MSAEKILSSWKQKKYKPVYWLQGEEEYYIDMIVNFAEHELLPESEASFNLTVFYGKDAEWATVMNACKRYPMFAEKQVVILKDAAALRGLNELAAYVAKPSPTTIFVIEHRFKKADGKTKLVKMAKEKGFHFTSDKIKDEHMPAWIIELGKQMNFSMGVREAETLASSLGNDLQKVVNEIEKVRINVPDEKELTAALIHKYIGISRDYNVFEFPEALANGDRDKVYRMLTYFLANPKSAPMALITVACYNHFNRLYVANFMRGKTDKDAAAAMGMSPYFVKNIMAAAQQWPMHRAERALLLLAKYNTKGVGYNTSAGDKELLKELVAQLLD